MENLTRDLRYALGMPAKSLVVTAAVLLSLTLGGGAAAVAERHPFVVGEPLPELLLPSAEDGRPRSLAEFRGRKLVLHVFASW